MCWPFRRRQIESKSTTCPTCKGTGKIHGAIITDRRHPITHRCGTCGGKGRVRE